MPKLFVKAGAETGAYDLRIGINRIGRGPDNHLQIHEPSVSGYHCELMLGAETIIVTDLGSSNGTFVDGVLIREGFLFPGQNLRLGRVEMFVEARLQLAQDHLTPWHRMNAVRESSGLNCVHHDDTKAVFFCPKCSQQLCHACTHSWRQSYGLKVNLCRTCGSECEQFCTPRLAVAPLGTELVEQPPLETFQESVRQSLIPHLAAWLKQKFIQVLLLQRDGFIETQEAATKQMLAFEQRLAKVQSQMDERIQSYEEHIRSLERDLAAAEAENQNLIRARIASMRAEIENESKLLIGE